MNASGCGVTVKDYGHALAHDPAYADKAARISALTRDLSELLPDLVPRAEAASCAASGARRLAFHPPCTLQHGQQLRGGVETHLGALGFDVQLAASESHLCCGSAGTYSVLQPELATSCATASSATWRRWRPRSSSRPTSAASSTCNGTTTPVRHWVEVLDDALG